ncbi:hypothetical protein MGSAQ_000607, partial [marine sediment metagenome]
DVFAWRSEMSKRSLLGGIKQSLN